MGIRALAPSTSVDDALDLIPRDQNTVASGIQTPGERARHGLASVPRLAGRHEMPAGDEADNARFGLPSASVECSTLLRDVRILIVDDSTLNRETLVAIFTANGAATPSIAWDLTSLISAFGHDTPGIILLNIATRDSAALLRVMAEISPNSRVIALGVAADDESSIVMCAEAGVAGYHLRTESLDDLLALIPRVAAGETFLSAKISAMLLKRLSALAAPRPVARELVLTEREDQILRVCLIGISRPGCASRFRP